MTPFRSPLKAHRIYDPASSVSLPDIGSRTPLWRVSTGQPATVKAACVPSIADATAKWLLDDPIANPSLLGSGYLHLTPEGNRLETGLPTRYPRYVYVIGGENLDIDFYNALQAAYAPLAGIGGRLVFGLNGATTIAVSNPHAIVVPISGGTSSTTGEFNSSLDTRITDEAAADYDAGELFIAVVQGSSSGSTFYWANQVTGTNANYANATLHPGNCPGYTVVESVNDGSTDYYLIINAAAALHDATVAAPHIARYKKFRQKYYLPNVAVESFSGVPPFSTAFEDLLDLVNPAGHESGTYLSGNAGDAASQIIADAVAFFS